MRLEPGDVIAFGGSHFVYRVDIEREDDADATATRTVLYEAPPPAPEASAPAAPDPLGADPDKTTFVGAADSFLDIFCVDYAAAQEDEVNLEPMPDGGHAPAATSRAPRAARWPCC